MNVAKPIPMGVIPPILVRSWLPAEEFIFIDVSQTDVLEGDTKGFCLLLH